MNLVILGIQWYCLQMKHHLFLRKLLDAPWWLCLKETGVCPSSISNSGCDQMTTSLAK